MNNRHYLILLIGSFLSLQSCIDTASYLNQKTPGTTPEILAPGLINSDSIELNGVFNADITEFFFTRRIQGNLTIHHSERLEGQWKAPSPIQLFPDETIPYLAADMTITQDGNTLYFLGRYEPDTSKVGTLDLYSSNKVNGKWQLAKKLPAPISSKHTELYPVVVADGSLYFISDRPGGIGKRDVYRAQYLEDGTFEAPKSLGPTINKAAGAGDTFVSADESYLIYSTTNEEGVYAMQVSFKKDGEWQTPITLNETINTEQTDFCPYMTPDHAYFLFSRRFSDPLDGGWDATYQGSVYWVDSEVVLGLREE